jgi:YcxB-like protein
MEKINIQFILQQEDTTQSVLAYSKARQVMLSVFRGIAFFPALYLLVSLFLSMYSRNFQETVSLFFPFFLSAFAISYPYSLDWIKKRPSLQSSATKEINYDFDDENFSVTSGDLMSNLSWTDFVNVLETNKYYFFHCKINSNLVMNMFLLLPKRAIDSITQEDSIRSLIEKKIGKIEYIGDNTLNWQTQFFISVTTSIVIIILGIIFFVCLGLFLENQSANLQSFKLVSL